MQGIRETLDAVMAKENKIQAILTGLESQSDKTEVRDLARMSRSNRSNSGYWHMGTVRLVVYVTIFGIAYRTPTSLSMRLIQKHCIPTYKLPRTQTIAMQIKRFEAMLEAEDALAIARAVLMRTNPDLKRHTTVMLNKRVHASTKHLHMFTQTFLDISY